MGKLGRENSGKPKDIEVLENMERFLILNDYDLTVKISTANLKWLVDKAGRQVRNVEQRYFD